MQSVLYSVIGKESVVRWLATHFHYFAWGQAIIATAGSLYFSEVRHFIPCTLCWYQRILMYPLVIVLGVAILLGERRLRYYVLPFTIPGLLIAAYHNLLWYRITEEAGSVCSGGVSCSIRWIEWGGFIGIPLLSLTAFLLITSFVLMYQSEDELEASDVVDDDIVAQPEARMQIDSMS